MLDNLGLQVESPRSRSSMTLTRIWHTEVIGTTVLELREYSHKPGRVTAYTFCLCSGMQGTCAISKGCTCVKLNKENPDSTIKWALSRIKKHLPKTAGSVSLLTESWEREG